MIFIRRTPEETAEGLRLQDEAEARDKEARGKEFKEKQKRREEENKAYALAHPTPAEEGGTTAENVKLTDFCRSGNHIILVGKGEISGQIYNYIVKNAPGPGVNFPVGIEGQFAALEKACAAFRQQILNGKLIPV